MALIPVRQVTFFRSQVQRKTTSGELPVERLAAPSGRLP